MSDDNKLHTIIDVFMVSFAPSFAINHKPGKFTFVYLLPALSNEEQSSFDDLLAARLDEVFKLMVSIHPVKDNILTIDVSHNEEELED